MVVVPVPGSALPGAGDRGLTLLPGAPNFAACSIASSSLISGISQSADCWFGTGNLMIVQAGLGARCVLVRVFDSAEFDLANTSETWVGVAGCASMATRLKGK